MELKPVRDAQAPKYPIKEEVGAERIKTSVMSYAAKVAMSVLTVTSLAGCTVAEAVELTVTSAPSTENTVCQTTATAELEVTAGVPMAPAIPLWPFFIAAAGITAVAILFFRWNGRGKKGTKHTDDNAPGDDY